MATSPTNTSTGSSQILLEGTSSESSRSSDSLPEACADNDVDDSPAGLAGKQHRGLNELRDKRDSKYEHIRGKFAQQRDQTRRYYETQRAEAEESYENGMCSCTFQLFFRQYLQQELADIYERERNGMVVLLEGERIESGAVERKHEDRERNYIRQCRKEWAKEHPTAPFWYDGEETSSYADGSAEASASGLSFV
ncbi:hypothetical protein LZ30DRAFT_589987 [Colletotrichum cereale]|nr:hypothetical protein LZ30DRAFT_589987 [Colletotrichum cereale]